MSSFFELGLSTDPGWLLRVPDVPALRHIVWRVLDGQRIVDPGTTIPVEISKGGDPLAFSLTAAGIPVVRSDVARMLETIAQDDVQFIPAAISGCAESFEILNVATLRDCIDESASSFSDYRGPGDFHAVNKLVIDPSRTGGSQIFRVTNCPLALVVSDAVRQMLSRIGVRGVGFFPVTPGEDHQEPV
jgi:hypothetical protein